MKHIGIIFGIILLSVPAMADLASTTYVSTVENGLNNNISGKLDNKFTSGANKVLVTTGTNGAVFCYRKEKENMKHIVFFTMGMPDVNLWYRLGVTEFKFL